MLSKSIFTYAVSIMLISGATGAAQKFPPARATSDYNVELLNFGAPKYVGSVPADGQHSGMYMNSNLHRIPDWKPSTEVPLAVAVMKAEFWLEEGAVRFEVFAYLGEIAPDSKPPDWEKLQKIKIVSRLLPMEATVNIEETQKVGIETFQVRAFRAGPWSVGPPEIVNKTRALNVESTTEERPAYTVTVRNVATKNIAAIEWYGIENDRKGGGSGIEAMRLLPAGKLFQLHQHFANSGDKQTDNANPELPRRRQIVIAAVLFDDGTFEGEVEIAAGVAVRWVGQSWQYKRLTELLENEAANLDPDQNNALAKLKTDVQALSEDADPAVATRILAHFPGIAEELQQRLIKNTFKSGLGFAKFNVVRDIEKFQYQLGHGAEVKDVRTWLTETIQKYKKLQSPYL